MNNLQIERKAQIIKCLVDGCSVRATARIVDVSRITVDRLLVQLGATCKRIQDQAMTNLTCKRVQIEELWGFCCAKDKIVSAHFRCQFGFGSVWTFVGIDADSRLIVAWRVGNRDLETARLFMAEIASRIANRMQLISDGHHMYLQAIEEGFGGDVDFAHLQKIYAGLPSPGPDNRYSPDDCCGTKEDRIEGNADPRDISTSFVERQNPTMRMNMLRQNLLTNAFSKKVERLEHATAIHFMHYNFMRIHQTLRVTPAIEAGITDHPWTVEEVLGLLDGISK